MSKIRANNKVWMIKLGMKKKIGMLGIKKIVILEEYCASGEEVLGNTI